MTLNIKTDNAAFKDPDCEYGGDCSTDDCTKCLVAEQAEVARILRVVATRLTNGQMHGRCADVNGNFVGEFSL